MAIMFKVVGIIFFFSKLVRRPLIPKHGTELEQYIVLILSSALYKKEVNILYIEANILVSVCIPANKKEANILV